MREEINRISAELGAAIEELEKIKQRIWNAVIDLQKAAEKIEEREKEKEYDF